MMNGLMLRSVRGTPRSTLVTVAMIADNLLFLRNLIMGLSARPSRPRLVVLFCLVALVFGIIASTPQPIQAQESEAKAEEKAGDAPLPSLPEHLIKSAGWFFGPLLALVSICMVTLIVLLALDLRAGLAIPHAFVDEFTDIVNKRQFKQAFELCKEDNSFLARVLTAGMSRLQYGIDDAREASLNMVESIKAGKENLINYLGTIGTLGPMLGLVGTVYGMILAFMEMSSGKAPDAGKLAGAISHALVVTLIGIAISVPAIFCHALFRNRLTRISWDASTLSDDLLTQMYHNSKRPAAAPAPTPAPDARTAPVAG
jgi:biopolymer transport protein ExbB